MYCERLLSQVMMKKLFLLPLATAVIFALSSCLFVDDTTDSGKILPASETPSATLASDSESETAHPLTPTGPEPAESESVGESSEGEGDGETEPPTEPYYTEPATEPLFTDPTPTEPLYTDPPTEPYTDPTPSPADIDPSRIAVVDGITYIDGIMIVNKTYALPSDYDPGADPAAVDALYTMFAAARGDGIELFVKSGFRSYIDQRIIYDDYVLYDGRENADRYSARPGHSEHQTGLAFDLNLVDDSFAGTPEAVWLENNCHKFGFIIRYPAGKEAVTGYLYEPWHVRYIGAETATAVRESGLCLEEYLGITSVYPD